MLAPAIIELVAGLIIVGLAVRMGQGRVQRHSAAGVRTPATMRSDETFRVANHAAAPLTGLGGAIMVACGAAATAVPKHYFGILVFGGVGAFLVVGLVGAAIGVRAARAIP
jgi:uncharacterized membrane protein